MPTDLDTLTAVWRAHGYQLVLVGLVVTAIVLTLTLVVAHRRGHTNQWVARVASVAVLALSAEGMWVVARERLHLPVVLAGAVFFVAEALMVSAALQARRHYERTTERDTDGRLIRPGHPGPHGRAVWVIAAVAGGIVALNSKSAVEVPLRLALPLAAAYMWQLALTADGTTRPAGAWRWTPRRLLVRLGAIDPTEADLTTADRERRTTTMTVTARRVHSGARPAGWHLMRLQRLAANADPAMVAEVARRVRQAHRVRELTDPAVHEPSTNISDDKSANTAAARELSASHASDAHGANRPARTAGRRPTGSAKRTESRRTTAEDYLAAARAVWAPGVEVDVGWIREVTGCSRTTAYALLPQLREHLANDPHTPAASDQDGSGVNVVAFANGPRTVHR
ncbi:hypothetical protein ABN028_20170 [Actinopolymorpha sp. B17G11]|uniref:hypothetical protein n=1 Tax=Actinopolymorpha sp. B17G11 TaxID=3160861 RepID=UPI0032E50516